MFTIVWSRVSTSIRTPRSIRFVAAAVASVLVSTLVAANPKAAEADQLRVVQSMSVQMRARIDQLPVLIAADHSLAKIEERTVILNRNALVIEGQRFDGVVVVAPPGKASFGWAFVSPANVVSWYVLREKGEMKGFADFLRRPRPQYPLATAMKPEKGTTITFQKLDSAMWMPGERYVLWFRFNDEGPAEFSIRAAFFARPSLSNNALYSLLFPAEAR